MAEIDNIPEMRPSFDNIRRQDEGGNEYWSSRDLCAAMGYSAYWKFQRVIDKAIKVAGEKGMNVDDHFNQAVDMVRLERAGAGVWSFRWEWGMLIWIMTVSSTFPTALMWIRAIGIFSA